MATRKKQARKSTRSNTRKTKDTSIRGYFVTMFRWGLVASLWGALLLGGLFVWYASELPNVTEAMVFERRPSIIIKASDGTIVDRYGDTKGETVSVENLPPHVIYAVLATEDRRFYEHGGIDPLGIARAMTVNLMRGNVVQGGSTITQQLAKNLFLSRERTLKRKVQEAMLAVWLERKLTKDEILSAYLNRVYLGSGAYGIDAASRIYFNKTAKELSLREAATIAGLLKAPSRYSPAANPELSARRTQVVLHAMVDAGFIEEADIKKLSAIPPAPRRKPSSGETVRYFTDYVVGQMGDLVGMADQDLIVETTLNRTIQEKTEAAVTKYLLAASDQNATQAAAVIMGLDGSVVALVGGRDYGTSEFNRATEALRAPGSSFKPLVYLAALEHGYAPDTMVVDEPITEGRYRPRNYGGEYFGEVTLTEALTRSLNTVAVNLMRETGPDAVINVARRLGITADLEPDLSLALGSSGVPVIQMATAYAALGRGGSAVEPYAITRITDKNGKIYYERRVPSGQQQVIDRRLAYELAGMMRSVVENGTGRAAMVAWPAAGKTGTSQDFRDAWFNGFTDRYAAAVWVGNDDNTPTKRVTGGSYPAQIWREAMTAAMNQPGAPSFGVASNSGYGTDFGFDGLLTRLLGENGSQESGGFFGRLFQRREEPSIQQGGSQQKETPLGRHQWDLNN